MTATPDIWEQADRRLLGPEDFELMAPGLALYREVWNATPEDTAQ